MRKPNRPKRSPGRSAPAEFAYGPEAQELRALLRRVPDGFQATLKALETRSPEARERVLTELARGMGKEILPLFRAAALGPSDDLARSAFRVLPVFGTRAAGDVLQEAFRQRPGAEWAELAWRGALALQARGIHVEIPEPPQEAQPARYTLRETWVSAPDGVGSRSVAARLKDAYGVWHAILVLCNDEAGVKDAFMRPVSQKEWGERVERAAERDISHVQCPPDYARWLVAEARKLNDRSGLPLGDRLKDWDALVGPPPDGYEPPDPTEEVRQAPREQQDRWLLESGNALFRTADLQRWLLDAADCAGWARKVNDIRNRARLRRSGRETGRDDDEELMDETTELLVTATRDLIDERHLRLYRGRLLDLARVCTWRRHEEPARRAAAAVLSIDRGESPDRIPFFLELVQRSVLSAALLIRSGEDLERLRYRPERRYQS